jgi:hypothetical protein
MFAPHTTTHQLSRQDASTIDDANYVDKHDALHVEKLGLDEDAFASSYTGEGLLKSRFDELSIPRTLWVFRRPVLVVLAVYTGYMCEGFEVSPGWGEPR